jgi:DNA-binding LacI/PurR family transcriptional regulator
MTIMVSARKIAKEAGVSIGTVSRVLNNKAGVSEDTRRRVMEIAQGLNYVLPRRLPLTMTATTHIGLLVKPVSESSILANPFYADVYHGVEQACSEYGIQLAFNVLEVTDDHLRKPPTLLSDERIGGLIVIGALPRAVVEAVARASATPIVLVDNWAPDTPWDCVMIDNLGGMAAVVEHLIEQGHRQIIFVSGPDHPSIVERRTAYEEVMRTHQLAAQIIETPDLSIRDGEVAADMLLEDHTEATAVVCSNDAQAIGVIRRLTQEGICIPRQMAVSGFDDVQMASFIQPTLTTAHVDRVAFGRLAFELLLGRIQAPHRPVVRCTMCAPLVVRESTLSSKPGG